jgi:hypothetical protein
MFPTSWRGLTAIFVTTVRTARKFQSRFEWYVTLQTAALFKMRASKWRPSHCWPVTLVVVGLSFSYQTILPCLSSTVHRIYRIARIRASCVRIFCGYESWRRGDNNDLLQLMHTQSAQRWPVTLDNQVSLDHRYQGFRKVVFRKRNLK